jgi:hypothetical protein
MGLRSAFIFSGAATMPVNPHYRHGPVLDTRRKRCPICHQAVYSLAGIHPQCAIKLVDSSPLNIPIPDGAGSQAPYAITLQGAAPPVKRPAV